MILNAYSIGDSTYTKFIEMVPWVDHDLFYGKVKFCKTGFSLGKSESSGFSETIAACDLKVGRCRHLIEFMKVYGYSISFFTFVQIMTWVDLDVFNSKVKICNLGFYLGKCDNDGFFGNYPVTWNLNNIVN